MFALCKEIRKESIKISLLALFKCCNKTLTLLLFQHSYKIRAKAFNMYIVFDKGGLTV